MWGREEQLSNRNYCTWSRSDHLLQLRWCPRAAGTKLQTQNGEEDQGDNILIGTVRLCVHCLLKKFLKLKPSAVPLCHFFSDSLTGLGLEAKLSMVGPLDLRPFPLKFSFTLNQKEGVAYMSTYLQVNFVSR